jgi:hypothetical protein
MSIVIYRSIDIENEVRLALKDHFKVYVRPLPEDFETPSVLIELMGGTSANTIDNFIVRFSARAETDADALDLLRTILGFLKYQTEEQFGELRYSEEQTMTSWGTDPVRPDLKLCQATVEIVAHKEPYEIES